MRQYVLIFLGSCLLLWGAERQSHAGFSLSLSAGGNYSLHVLQADSEPRGGMNLEFNFNYQLLLISFDLGVVYDFFKEHIIVRPGVKLHLGWLYFRLALPMDLAIIPQKYRSDFNFGILGGIGVHFKFRKIGFFAEANISPFFLEINSRGVILPAELRLGIAYHF